MKEVDLHWFYQFGYYLQPLLYLRKDLPSEVSTHLFTYARIGLTLFAGDPNHREMLPQSVELAEGLTRQIDIWTGVQQDDVAGKRTWSDVPGLLDWVKSFSTTLKNETDRLDAFCVTGQGNLSARALMDGATGGYSPRVVGHLSSICKTDIDEAGRCLAFERSAACGFHILRAVEGTMELYIVKAQGTIPNLKTWHEYIVAIDACGGSDKVRNLLRSMKDQYRNPLMHPEDTLDQHQAIGLFNLSQTAIEALITELLNRQLIQD